MATTNIISGARSVFKINGRKIALATGVSVNTNIGLEPFRPLDTLFVQEFVPVSSDASISCDLVVAVGSDPTQQGFFPLQNNLSILTFGEMTCEILDSVTNQLILICQGVLPSANNRTFRSGQITANDVSFVCKRVLSVTEANGTQPPPVNSPTGTVSGNPGN